MNHKIAIIGLGYVGLPLAVEFSKKYPTFGFDINQERISQLQEGIDQTLEVESQALRSVLSMKGDNLGLRLTSDVEDIKSCNTYIITVPTPIDEQNNPNLLPLLNASKLVGELINEGDIVIYESTVYPGVTEDECVPVLEQSSGFKYNQDFYCGYSPERINPGDKEHTLTKITKVTSGSTPEISNIVDQLYRSIISAGTLKVSSIKIAEAAKVIENSQRDINIAFVNELSKIFHLIGIDTNEVLEAAGTKWNFLPFKPGLVGGHCIGVDPYFIAKKAQQLGYHPEIILAGRKINDSMGHYVASHIMNLAESKNIEINNKKALILGITFKENCPDIRNTKVTDLYHSLKGTGLSIDVFDPWVAKDSDVESNGIKILSKLPKEKYTVIVLAVAHNVFKNIKLADLREHNSIIYDVKGFYAENLVDARL